MQVAIRIVSLFFLLLLSACSVDVSGTEAARAAGDPAVQLVSARTKVVYEGGCRGYLSGDIELENLAYAKNVQIHYSVNGGAWQDAPAGYAQSLGNNRERWSFRFSVGVNDGIYDMRTGYTGPAWNIRFAVKYTVNGRTYWDNNGGAGQDYRISTPGSGGLYATAALGKSAVSLYYACYSDFPTTYFRGYVVAKASLPAGTPKVVFTIDGWKTTQVLPMAWGPGTVNGVSSWYFMGREYGDVTVEFALAYESGGVTYWDNNFGRNYRVGVGVTAP